MKLAVPLTVPGEAAILSAAGATEFYCGLQTAQWQEAFGDHDSISRRQGVANLATLDELRLVLDETAGLGAPLFLTVNSNYSEEQLPSVLSLIESFEEMGGTGVMITDIALLSLLYKRGSRLIRGLSLLAAVSSLSAVKFYRELGVTRIVFPRFLDFKQISAITSHFPEIQTECIVWLDKCRFIDGYCRFMHSVGYQGYSSGDQDGSHSCSGGDQGGSQGCNGGDQTGMPMRTISAYDMDYCRPACFELLGNPPIHPACAACDLVALEKAGVSIFKLGGRGRPLELRLSGVRFLTAAYGEGSQEGHGIAIKELYRQIFGEPCSVEACYYGKRSAGNEAI